MHEGAILIVVETPAVRNIRLGLYSEAIYPKQFGTH